MDSERQAGCDARFHSSRAKEKEVEGEWEASVITARVTKRYVTERFSGRPTPFSGCAACGHRKVPVSSQVLEF